MNRTLDVDVGHGIELPKRHTSADFEIIQTHDNNEAITTLHEEIVA